MLWRKYFDDGLLDFCEQNGTGVIAYGPLAYGLLTGTITAATTFDDNDWRSGKKGFSYYDRLFKPGVIEGNLEIVDRLRPIADRIGCALSQLALAWLFTQLQITGAIAGSRKADHVRENAEAGDVVLTEKDMEEIASILGA
jgi:aryl-alcohol dehydrogenase-like predicted oxidoreductase